MHPARRYAQSFDGLAGLVRQSLDADPLAGDLFVFFGKRRDKVKLLYWTGDGYALWYKRLEAGTFAWPTSAQAARPGRRHGPGRTWPDHPRMPSWRIVLDGVELASVQRRRRYQRPAAHAS